MRGRSTPWRFLVWCLHVPMLGFGLPPRWSGFPARVLLQLSPALERSAALMGGNQVHGLPKKERVLMHLTLMIDCALVAWGCTLDVNSEEWRTTFRGSR